MPFDGTHLDPATQLLIEAKERIERCGWCKRAFRTPKGRFCMLGAFRLTLYSPLYYDPITRAALQRLTGVIGTADIATWNDHPCRTKGQVLAAFDKAIALNIAPEDHANG